MDAEMQYWQAMDEARIERERAKDARIAELEEALRKIAAFGDKHGEDWLERSGSYSMFDEPIAVEIARTALKEADQ